MTGQRRDVFPERSIHWEIQNVPQNGITLGTWRIRQCGPLPFPNEGNNKNVEQQRIEDKVVNHCDKGGTRGAMWDLIPVS